MGNLDDVTFTNMVEMDEPPWTRSKTSSTEVYIDRSSKKMEYSKKLDAHKKKLDAHNESLSNISQEGRPSTLNLQ
jgi:hypothetical protein